MSTQLEQIQAAYERCRRQWWKRDKNCRADRDRSLQRYQKERDRLSGRKRSYKSRPLDIDVGYGMPRETILRRRDSGYGRGGKKSKRKRTKSRRKRTKKR